MVDTTLHGSGVYAITSLACGRMYVGSSVNIPKRWKQHKNELSRGIHRTARLQAAWVMYGEANFTIAILEPVSDKALLRVREQFWLDSFDAVDRGFNTLYIVDHPPQWTTERRAALSAKRMGHTVSTETREKLRQANLGKKHTDESKALRRAWSAGRKMSPEAIAKTAAFWTGRKHSEKSRSKMSETQRMLFVNGLPHPWKGRKHSPETIAKMTGRQMSQEAKAKLSETRKALFANGYVNPQKGKKLSPETVAWLKARPISQETRDKVSRGRKAYFARLRGE